MTRFLRSLTYRGSFLLLLEWVRCDDFGFGKETILHVGTNDFARLDIQLLISFRQRHKPRYGHSRQSVLQAVHEHFTFEMHLTHNSVR
uniref:Putative secreted protein n=1 Tax=Anopheles triannulatus TaxID=58253 RepID=A0A2M4B5U6_9DIPT